MDITVIHVIDLSNDEPVRIIQDGKVVLEMNRNTAETLVAHLEWELRKSRGNAS